MPTHMLLDVPIHMSTHLAARTEARVALGEGRTVLADTVDAAVAACWREARAHLWLLLYMDT